MITLVELLDDPRYKKFFTTIPKVNPAIAANWRLYIQRKADGPWARKDYSDYADAFRKFAKELKRGAVHDGTIQSRGIAYSPPQRIVAVTSGGRPVYIKDSKGSRIQKTAVVVWRPRLPAEEEAHSWCTYCRRPTVFKWFLAHHALNKSPVAKLVDPADRRCTICGAREEFIRSTAKSAFKPGQPIEAVHTPRRKR